MVSVGDQINISEDGLAILKPGEGSDVTIINNSLTQYVSGLGVKGQDGNYYGICAGNIFGHIQQMLRPRAVFFLAVVSNVSIVRHLVVDDLECNGVLVDFSQSSEQTMKISYDINNGWSQMSPGYMKVFVPSYKLSFVLNPDGLD